VERIKVSTDRMSSLLGDFAHAVTPNQARPVLTSEAVNLGTAIDDAIAAASAQLREKNIALRVNLPEQLPEIRANRDALQQILINLLQNAGAATPVEGEISLRAHFENNEQAPSQDSAYVLLQVADSGGGIPAEDLPRVFSRLYRADNPIIQGMGDTGVGLSVVKSLVEAQGGRIWVDAEAGVGSTFSVLLPLAGEAPGAEV
jgi:signal transduction histidine kinase